METKITINGRIVSYDNSVSEGVRHLSLILSREESKIFFDQAFEHGYAMFEDRMGHNYKLTHVGSEYQLAKA